MGDFGDGDIGILKNIKNLTIPKAVILGNHDHGHDKTGSILKAQIDLLGDIDCSWKFRNWDQPNISLIGARPCSPGGGFYISPEVKAVFGEKSLEDSVDLIVSAAKEVPIDLPLVILSHSGPAGLGSAASSPCGRDWKTPSIDWGDKDLALAIDQIRKVKVPDLVVFGHTHHQLRRGKGRRVTFSKDIWGTIYLNAAFVPRRGKDNSGEYLTHFSWVEFENNKLEKLSHRWYRLDASLAYEETLYKRN